MIRTMLKDRAKRFWREWMKPILVILIITSAFRSAMADWNDVPTGSMKPTILEGERIFINKLAYDLKVPFTTVRIAQWSDPKRGEIVVLFSPYDGRRLVKRVVGMPGDTVEMRNDEVRINGKAVHYVALQNDEALNIYAGEQQNHIFFDEMLGERKHAVMITPAYPALRSFGPLVIPQGRYFVMGDNRDNSLDSRFFGPVDRTQIIGRATAVVASVDPQNFYRPRWSRWFTALQ